VERPPNSERPEKSLKLGLSGTISNTSMIRTIFFHKTEKEGIKIHASLENKRTKARGTIFNPI
jgi:hypothetical protein